MYPTGTELGPLAAGPGRGQAGAKLANQTLEANGETGAQLKEFSAKLNRWMGARHPTEIVGQSWLGPTLFRRVEDAKSHVFLITYSVL